MDEFAYKYIRRAGMRFQDLIKKRRSIRRYTDKPVEKETLEEIAGAALYAPTAVNFDTIKVMIITDKEKLAELSSFKRIGAGMLKKAQAAMAVISDPEISPKTHRQDAAIAATYVLLAATNEGLGSCWVNVNSSDEGEIENAHRILGLDPELNIESIISLGYPNEDPGEKIPREKEGRIIWK
jgi:nitroreductase